MESLSTLEKIEISKLLLKVKDAGVTVKPGRDNSLLMTGPRDAGIVASLKENKLKILALFKDPSHGIEQCVDRLRKGQRTLIKMNEALYDKDGSPVGSPAMVSKFSDALVTWDILDEWLRKYGEYGDQCPIGPKGCDMKSPVICRFCGKKLDEDRRRHPSKTSTKG